MNFNFSLFFAALGLACVLEAMPWVISPAKTREALLTLLDLSDEQQRMGGIILMALGILACAASCAFRGD